MAISLAHSPQRFCNLHVRYARLLISITQHIILWPTVGATWNLRRSQSLQIWVRVHQEKHMTHLRIIVRNNNYACLSEHRFSGCEIISSTAGAFNFMHLIWAPVTQTDLDFSLTFEHIKKNDSPWEQCLSQASGSQVGRRGWRYLQKVKRKLCQVTHATLNSFLCGF